LDRQKKLAAAIAVRDMILNATLTQMVGVVARLGIADLLKDGAKTSEELAGLTDADAGALYRLLRGLASVGVFAETEGRKFELTAMADCLRSDSEFSMKAYAVWGGSECWWRSWGNSYEAVKTGRPVFKSTLGMEIFEYFGQHPEMADVFNTFMNERIVPIAKAVCGAYDFSRAKKVVDIGGGGGLMLATILRENRHLNGVVQDLPSVIASEGHIIEKMRVAERCKLVGLSFFDDVSAGGDIYILSAIIHDWDDESCIKILKNCHKQMRDGGKLLLIESVIAKGNNSQFGKLTDLNMMVLAGGKERTAEEFRELLSASGFEMERVIPTATDMSIIESVKKDKK
jgi:hypothetical protein